MLAKQKLDRDTGEIRVWKDAMLEIERLCNFSKPV
jgi:hypothetical protein